MTHPSARVRLEVAFLDGDQVPAPDSLAAPGEGNRITVLVVAAEADLRCYVRECLRERPDLHLLEAATVAEAVLLAAGESPEFLVVDHPERDVLIQLSEPRAIVIVDDVPRGATAAGARIRLLARPFTAERLVTEVRALLS